MRFLPFYSAAFGLVATFALSSQTPSPQKESKAPPPADDTALSTQSASQTPATDANKTATLSVQARLVVVPAVVRDKKGAIIGSLAKDNFALSVDGKPQTLRYFDHDNDLPLTVGLLIDTSGSQTSVLDDERKASGVFLDKMLASAASQRAADKSFLIEFAHTAELLQDVTDSHPKLQQALKDVDQSGDRPSFGSGSGSGSQGDPQDPQNGGDRRSRGYGGGGTVLYDAVYLASDEIESKQSNRRALVVLTDGDDRGSKESLAHAIEAAQRADTVIYAIYYKGESHGGFGNGGGFPGGGGGRHGGGFPGGGGGGYPGGGGGGYPGGGGNGGGRGGGGERVDGKKILERMCGETGGRMFEVSRKNTLDVIYAQIGDELRQGYRLGFTPNAEAAEEGYHRIDLQLAGPPTKDKLNVQTRDGYYTAGK